MSKINWEDGLALERDCAIILREQEENGVYFDTELAYKLINNLEEIKLSLETLIRPYIKPIVSQIGTVVSKVYLKNGDYNSSILKHYPEDYFNVEGPFSRIEILNPDISQRKVLIDQLLSRGWKPTLFTEKGFPKLTDKGEPVETLLQVGDFGKSLSSWYVYSHRQSQIQGFLQYVRDDHRIPASISSCATNTFRAAHRIVANIPRPGSVFGKEMRSLFSVPKGRKFVGADLSGLEARMLCHHMNDSEYTNQLLNGDIHEFNRIKAGLPTRDNAKTFFYGFLYGSGDKKTGSIIGKGAKEGKEIKEIFFKEIPSLSKLINKVKSFAERTGYLPSIDGRKIYIRSYEGRLLIHTALNCLLQANGSIVAKRAMKIANDRIKELGLDAFQIIFYHDEFAYDSAEECAEEVGKILVDSMRLAGEYYNLRIPIDGEYGIGDNWGIH